MLFAVRNDRVPVFGSRQQRHARHDGQGSGDEEPIDFSEPHRLPDASASSAASYAS
jgi:hypothetical protein